MNSVEARRRRPTARARELRARFIWTSGLMTALLCASLYPAPARAAAQREEFSRTFQRSVSLQPGQSVRLEHRMGSIVVRTHAGSELSLNATIRVSAATAAEATEFGNQITFDV
jgi:hypothetical protein